MGEDTRYMIDQMIEQDNLEAPVKPTPPPLRVVKEEGIEVVGWAILLIMIGVVILLVLSLLGGR